MNLGERICIKLLKVPYDGVEIKNVVIGDEGRVRFRVPIENICLGDLKLVSAVSKQQALSSITVFLVDMAGELIVRKNFHSFLRILGRMSEKEYNEKLMPFNHLHFSMQKYDDEIEFTFHVSLLHDILIDKFSFQTEGKH